MATWKKVATYGAGDALEANITGIAYGGLDHTLTAAEGGTGADTSAWANMGSPQFNGSTWASISGPGGADKLLVSNDTGGGYLAPPEYVEEIMKKVKDKIK